jgi:hypothetical protein
VFVFNITFPLFKSVIADLGEIGWNGMDWIHLAHDRDQWQALVNTVMNLARESDCWLLKKFSVPWS